MTPDDVLQIVRCLETASIDVWLDGGWGIDALVGEHTRPHDDLDLVIRESHVCRLREVLGREGFRDTDGGVAWNFVLTDGRGRHVDVHAVRFDEDGNALYGPSGLMYPTGSLDGSGTVRGVRVRCKTAVAQASDRVGYAWRARDYQDVRLLHARFHVPA